MADINEYTIDGDELADLLTDIEEGGGLGIGAYKITIRTYPVADEGRGQVAFSVNDSRMGLPMGRRTRTLRAECIAAELDALV
jgi:hypothetical protein